MLFVLLVFVMEVFFRMFGKFGEGKVFNVYFKCGKVKLNYLCFLDDLFIFFRGDIKLVNVVIGVFGEFVFIFGL